MITPLTADDVVRFIEAFLARDVETLDMLADCVGSYQLLAGVLGLLEAQLSADILRDVIFHVKTQHLDEQEGP